MPVNASALIPPALELRSIQADSDHVFPTIIQHIADIVTKADVPTRLVAHPVTIHPHRAVAKSAIKFQVNPAIFICLRL
jgi:hypothetical protein